MDVPDDVRIRGALNRGTVYYFVNHRLSSIEPHYHVIVSPAPDENDEVLCVVASSQVASRQQARKHLPGSTLVISGPHECAFLKCPTVFDCNSPMRIPVRQIVAKYSAGNLIVVNGKAPSLLLQKLEAGIGCSPIVEQSKKNML